LTGGRNAAVAQTRTMMTPLSTFDDQRGSTAIGADQGIAGQSARG
jgi:hypothetical protein